MIKRQPTQKCGDIIKRFLFLFIIRHEVLMFKPVGIIVEVREAVAIVWLAQHPHCRAPVTIIIRRISIVDN